MLWVVAEPFCARKGPKSTGRELFGMDLVQKILSRYEKTVSGADLVRTALELTAKTISEALRTHGVSTVVVSGGGSHNPTLMRRLSELCPTAKVVSFDDWEDRGWVTSDSKEAAAFAVLGLHTLLGRPSNVPQVTGAQREVILGSIVCGTERKFV
jgi:anhydro-N-acetylmuramic acid kinase